MTFHLRTPKQYIRSITRHETCGHGGISKGNASVKSVCESELYFVKYGQLFEHVDYLSRLGKEKWRKLWIFDVNQDVFLPFW